MTAKKPVKSLVPCATCGHMKLEHRMRVVNTSPRGCAVKGCLCPGFIARRSPAPPRPKTVKHDWSQLELWDE